jgi:hypothetical protein
MNGLLSDSALMEMSKDDAYITSKEFSADRSSVRDLVADLGHFALSRFTALAVSRDLRSPPAREFNSIVPKQARRLAHSGREEVCTDLERKF